MARSLSKIVLVVDGISNAIFRRGYAAASNGAGASAGRGLAVKKAGQEKVAWVPHPVTGYYRPENRSDEVDVAELRALLLKNKTETSKN